MNKKTISNVTRLAGKLICTVAISTMLTVALCPAVRAQEASGFRSIAWEHGPAVVEIGDQATMDLPKGLIFTHAVGARKFLELNQNPPDGDELGILASEDYSWFAILSFSASGHVSDDDKDSLDADALLASIKKGTEEANEERKHRGWSTISVVGWMQPPHYDSRTRNLEWSLKGQDEDGAVVVNQFTRLLGRRGVVTVDFVASVDSFGTEIVTFRHAMEGFSYKPGNNYAAFVQGDKVAEYGLTGLIVGGAAAAAANAGMFKYLWKLIIAAVAAVGAFIKKLFSARPSHDTAQDR